MKNQASIFRFVLVLVSLLPQVLGAQNNYDSDKINKHTIKVNYLTPGAEYEGKVLEDFTVSFRAGLNFHGIFPNGIGERDSKVRPYGTIQVRRYYRTKETSNKGKKLIGNSGDFFGLRAVYTYTNGFNFTNEFTENYVLLVGPMYGLQRTFQNKLTWSFHVGGGAYLAGASLAAAPFVGLSIGSLVYKKD